MKINPRYLLVGTLGALLVGGGVSTALATGAGASVSHPAHTTRVVTSTVDTPEPGDTPDTTVDTPEKGDTPDTTVDTPEKGDTPDHGAAQSTVDTPEKGDTPDAAGK